MISAKAYLQQIRLYRNRIEAKKREAAGLQESISFLKGIDYSGDRVQTSPQDHMSGDVARLLDLDKEIRILIEKYHYEMDKRINQIHQLKNETYENVLIMRYIEDMTLDEIAKQMSYSYYWACHIHGEALKEFHERFLKTESK